MKYRAEEFPTYATPAAGLQTQMPGMSMQQAPGPSGPMAAPTDWNGIAASGVGGAGQAFQLLMQALARQQAIENGKQIAQANNESTERIAHGRIESKGRDFDASARVNAMRSFLQQAAQSGATNRAGLGNEQAATTGLSSAILNAFKGR